MKYVSLRCVGADCKSAPTRGPWIEIGKGVLDRLDDLSAPTRGPWIEIRYVGYYNDRIASAPTRGPWIEIIGAIAICSSIGVGPHTGAVD